MGWKEYGSEGNEKKKKEVKEMATKKLEPNT